MKRLRLGAVLHFLIAIGHIGCLFALDEAFEVYGIREIMHQMVSGQVWMLYALTIGLVLAFCLAGLYALSATDWHSTCPPSLMSIKNTSMHSRMVPPPFSLPPQSLGASVPAMWPIQTEI